MGLYFYSCKSFDFMGKGEKVMLKRGNAKRWKALSLAVALYVGGGQLSLNHVYAADVTGGDVTVDSSHPAPTPFAGGAITNTTNNGDVHNNTLTIDGININTHAYGGYNLSLTGDANNNILILRNMTSGSGSVMYGGYSQNGNAINNTIVLDSASDNGNFSYLWGGGSGNGSADVRTGNTLKVMASGSYYRGMANFEKLQFDLNANIANGSTMLSIGPAGVTGAFDWSNISVTGGEAWATGTPGAKRVILYTGAGMTLNNYDFTASRGTSGNVEYGLTTSAGAIIAPSVGISQIYFDVNQFKNGTPTYTTSNPPSGELSGGRSTLGNDVHHNTLTIDGVNINSNAYGGYNLSLTGNANNNTLILKNLTSGSGSAMYGGYSQNGNAINNTVVLNGASDNGYFSYLWGGGSGNGSADVRTGNTLKVMASGSYYRGMTNFEKLQFDLNANIANGSTMLSIGPAGVTGAFDWSNITVTGLPKWSTAMANGGINTPTLTLYSGAGFTVSNYTPVLVGTVGDYEFGKKANTSGTGTVGVSVLTLDANRFQNATAAPTAWAANVQAGLSTYGNTTNHNTLNINIGLTNARAGYTNALNGGSEHNTLNLLTGGSVTNGYAGYTEGVHLLVDPTSTTNPTAVDTTKNADAKNNTVNINGGTLNAGGKLYGGYIATNTALSATSAGDASGNTINIENGIFGGNTEIYGGYTNGTGKATGNTVNLGTTAGVLTSSTLQNVFIYGGAGASSSDVFTDNLLNVNAKGLTARNITNFGKTHFNLGGMGTIATTDQLLTLNGGATSGLDWAGVEVNPGSHTFMPGIYDARLFTAMHNAAGISFTKNGTDTYAPVGAKEFLKGDFEYIIDTASGTVSAQDVVVDGFRFRNHTGASYTTADGTHAAGWAGRTASGQTVENNKLLVSGGILTDAYGGLVENRKHRTDGTFQTTGDAKENILEITGGTVTNAYGAKVAVAAGNAEENSVKITGGTINTSAYGADLTAAAGTGTARKNKAEMTNGNITGSLYGAHTAGSGTLTESEVSVSGGTIGASVYGSDVAAGAGDATKSKIMLTGGAITGDVYGGRAAGTGAATGHTLNLNGGTVGGSVYGGHTASGATTGNTVNLGNGTTNDVTTVTGTIAGGNQAADTDNVLNVNTNATAGNIADFGMVKFNFNGTFNQMNPMLNLVGGSATNLDWTKFTHTGTAPSGQSILMQNLSNINVTNYTGAKEISSTGTNEYIIDTDTSAATAKQILFGGYQFKGAHTTPTTSDAAKDVWAGRSVIGNTTTENTLTINGTTHRDAYGGWTAGTGTTAAAKFDSTDNTVNLQAGNVRNIYGGFTSVQSGNATGNKIHISGGTVAPVSGVGGTVYGGVLSHAMATGNATGNAITITGGAMGDIYGGWTAGSGATTGNTVNLGTENDAVVSTTNITGTIYGGSKATATDNVLNVYDTVSAGNIANFDRVNFNASPHIAAGDTFLTLTGSSTTNLDWNKLYVDSLDNVTASATDDRIFTLLHNSNTINFTNYSTTGTRGRIRSADYEADITTDGNSATSQNVYLKGYRFQNNTTDYAGSTATDAWGGRSIIGNTVKKNQLTLTGGSATLTARGGMVSNTERDSGGNFKTTGDAEENELVLNTGAQTADAYGAEVQTKGGSAAKNTARLTGGTVAGSLYGAALTATGATGSVTESTVTLTGGTVAGTVYGGHTAGTGTVTGSTLNLEGGTVAGSVYGGFTAGGATTGNIINLGNGTTNAVTTVTGTIAGGNQATDTGNVLNVNTNAQAGNIANFGMVNFNFNTTFNHANPMLRLNGGAATNLDWGKIAASGTAPSGETVLMENLNNIQISNYTGLKELSSTPTTEYSIDTDNRTATAQQIIASVYQFKDANITPTTSDSSKDIWAGRSVIGNTTTGNTLTVSGTNHQDVYGGWTAGTGTSAAAKFDSTANTVNLQNGTVRTIYGGFTAAQSGNAAGNKVNISGGTATGTVYGGVLSHAAATGSATGNIVTITGGTMADVYGGFSAGAGATTGNIVNLGSESTAVTAGTTIGAIYGGSKATATGNTLNIYDSATAANIVNFDEIHFHGTNHIAAGDTLLSLNGTGATTLDWTKLYVDDLDNVTASATDDRIFALLTNANNINFGATYSATGTRGRIRSTDYEADITTDGNSATSQNVYLKGYRFQNNDTNYAGGTATDAWGGRSIIGNKVYKNTLTLTGGSAALTARGGMVSNTERDAFGNFKTQGDAEKNKLVLNTGAQTADAYGAEVQTKGGSAAENTARLTGGTVAGSLYGAALTATGATGSAATNKVELTGGIVTGSVYGAALTAAGATGSVTESTVTLKGGAIAGNAYGGYNAGSGDAKDNVVSLEGGSATNIYGGFAAGAGAATGNTVTLTGGTSTAVYGGFAAGVGAATGNIVNIGDGEHNLAVGTTIGALYGGNKAADAGNALHVKTNARADNIENFDRLTFHLINSTLQVASPLLELTAGATNNIDWQKLEVDATRFDSAISTYRPYKVTLMKNSAGIDLNKNSSNTYTAGGGVKNATSGDYEFIIDTLGSNVHTTEVNAEGYQFRNHTTASYAAADGTHTEAWAGRTNIGNKVENNTLKVTGGTLTTAAYGGLVLNNKLAATAGDAEKNTVAVTGGNVTAAYGADVRTKDGSASKNTAEITGGTTGSVYGASLSAAGATGDVTKSKINITGGAVTNNVYGGHIMDAAATGNITASEVNVAGGTVGGTLYAAYNSGVGDAKDNTVTITGGTLHDVYGGFAASGKTTGNTVNLGDENNAVAAGTTLGTLYGGSKADDVSGNTLNINSRDTQATDIKNFDTVNFDAAHNVSRGDTLLRLTNGAATSLDWGKMNLRNFDSLTASATTDRILTLIDSTNDVTFTNYDAARAKEVKTDGDYEYVLNTDNESDHAKKVDVTGYRFANNKPAYSAGSDTEAWGGRTKLGNKVENNTLKVTGGTLTTAAYGGLVENRAGDGAGGYKTTGDAAGNTLNLEGGTVQNAYGADVRTKDGSAAGNTVDLKGAVVTGSLYAGALTNAASVGNATSNAVNLYSGTVAGDVYAGYSSGSGAVTGNTVTIGDGANDASVTVTGTLYGGNKAALTGNTLDIRSKGASVGSIRGFETIKFRLDANIVDGADLLTLTQDTHLACGSIEKPAAETVTAWLGNAMKKNLHFFRMATGKTLTLDGYTPVTSSERSGDVEYNFLTDNNEAATTGGSLDLAAYRWQNADVEVAGTAENEFGGKSTYRTDGETKNNKLTLKAGANVKNAVAGDTQTAGGTAEGNTLRFEAGQAENAYGAKTVGGKALKNQAILAGGTAGTLKGAESTGGTAEENSIEITGGTVTTAIAADAAGDAVGNKAVLTAGAVTGELKGAKSAAAANKNTVEIKGGDIRGARVIGAEAAGNAEENVVTIEAAPTSNAAAEIIGGSSTGGSASNNILNVNAAVTGTLVGGFTASTTGRDAADNTLNINANITGDIYGGRAANASLRNIINIADGITVTGNVTGGSCIIANENIIHVGRGATVTGNVTGGNAATSDGNIINLTGSKVNGDIIGGTGAAANGNTLAVYHDEVHTSAAHDFAGIKNLQFYLKDTIANENPTLLQLGVTDKDIRGINVGVGVQGFARGLRVNDVVSLMKVNGGTLTTDADNAAPPNKGTILNHVDAMQGVSILYGFELMKRGNDELIATVTKAAISEQTKSFVETRAGATSIINGGADLLATGGSRAAKKGAAGEKESEKGKYTLWAITSRGNMRAESGSHIDTTGWNLSVGWSRETQLKSSTLIVSPFVEYGKGSYDSYLDDGTHGSGKISYLGAGVLARIEREDGFWLQGALHAGRARSDYTGSIYRGTVTTYDSSNPYIAAELSVGKETKLRGGNSFDTYLRYLWSHQNGKDISMSTGETYQFGSVDSHRLRLGMRYSHIESEGSELYAGLAWEYELSGKATATYQGYEAPSPSLRGGSALLELGWRFQPKDARVSYDLNLSGWQGKRQGVTCSAHVNWAF